MLAEYYDCGVRCSGSLLLLPTICAKHRFWRALLSTVMSTMFMEHATHGP